MNTVCSMIINFGLSVLASIGTTILVGNKLYGWFYRGKILENFHSNGPQISGYNVQTKADLENLILQAEMCENYVLEIKNETKDGKNYISASLQPITAVSQLDLTERWKYLYIVNHANINICIAKIDFSNNSSENLHNWPKHMLEQNEKRGIFINKRDEAQRVVIEHSGWDCSYAITEKEGPLQLSIKKAQGEPRKKARV